MKQLVALLTLVFLFQISAAQTKKVWIDTDILTGKPRKDVDDALALIMALRDTTLEIVGISTVQNVDYSMEVTKKLLDWYAPARNIAIYNGANGSVESGKVTDASNAIIAALEKEPMHILALGPITNIGTVMRQRQDLHSKIESITFCAGRKPGKLFNPGSGKVKFSDYNFDLDSKSIEPILASNIPFTLAGYDCSDSLFLDRSDFAHLKKSDHEGDKWLYKQLKKWESLWRVFMGSEKGFIPFDCATLGVFVNAEDFEMETTNSYVKVDKNDTKNQIKADSKPYLYVSKNEVGKRTDYCSYTKSLFKKKLLKAIDHPDFR